MEPIPCAFYVRLPQVRLYLRRFVMDGDCSKDYGDGHRRCCNGMVPLQDVVPVMDERGCFPQYPHPPHDDPRWPKVCEGCGGEFRPEHQWQVHIQHLYQTLGGGPVALNDLPVGAMWYQDFGHGPHGRWLLERNGHRWEDRMEIGRIRLEHLFVRTPGGVCDLDTIATNGDGWEVTGSPPLVTANPSLLQEGRWHGWLRSGILSSV